MREHSGKTVGTNNERDPTLRDHGGKGGTAHEGQDFTEGAAFGKDPPPDETLSPSKRDRGETASTDGAPPTDRS